MRRAEQEAETTPRLALCLRAEHLDKKHVIAPCALPFSPDMPALPWIILGMEFDDSHAAVA